MKVQFTPDINDYIYISSRINSRNANSSNIWATLYVLFNVGIVISFPALLLFLGYYIAGLVSFVIFLLLAFLLKENYEKSYYRNFYQNFLHGDDEQTEIEISERGIGCKCNGDEGLIAWKNIVDMEETENSIYLFTKCNGIAIRKSAFNSSEEMGQFISFVKSRLFLNH